MTIKIKLIPGIEDLGGEGGINTVVRKWYKYLPKYGVEIVGKKDDSFDVLAIHAGMSDKIPIGTPVISHLHGLYFTADYNATKWEWATNEHIIRVIRSSRAITVPSSWVAEIFQRDMRIAPHIVPHGVDIDEWSKPRRKGKFVVGYFKNRSYMDVCNPQFLTDLANKFPDVKFVSTYAVPGDPPNVEVTGVITHDTMPELMRDAIAVVSPIKETFGLLTLEAMAASIPVLGYAYGGNNDLIRHGETGYLARVNDANDLARGLQYCIENRNVLGDNAREVAKQYTWDKVCEQLAGIYQQAVVPQPPTVSIIIPCYNYSDKVGRAIESAQNQTVPASEIIVVDDGSPDDGATMQIVSRYSANDNRVRYIRQDNGGVATARNHGIDISTGKYIICLDADDAIAPKFIEACIKDLEADPSLGIAYTKLLAVTPDGKQTISPWPGQWNFDAQLEMKNQVPTACMFRKEMWRRLGGYRQRYAPQGAGAEDAEFWLRSGSAGWKAKLVTEAPLFIYSWLSGQVSGNRQYREVNWLELHPYTKDALHPFASYATPPGGRPTHGVRQYDEPVISVIIPVGPGHKSAVFNALDSLEAQTFRKWEAIVVDDSGNDDPWSFDGIKDMLSSYPYVRLVKTAGKMGAGFARNRGVDASRGSMILFLDADDNLLTGDALQVMIDTWNASGQIVYSDYVSKSYLDSNLASKAMRNGRMISYDDKTGLAMTRNYATDFDCERAILQPQEPLYIWNLITSLLPKIWHYEIGGFDESMPSWEDWVYWLEMARHGKCFIRIPEPLVVYRFYTGNRRETGIQGAQKLLQYITDKFSGVNPMPCGCRNKSTVAARQNAEIQRVEKAGDSQTAKNITDDDVVLILYVNPNTGQHRVVGSSGQDYGYRSGGGVERFYIKIEDQRSKPDIFKIVEPEPVAQEPEKEADPPPAPKVIKRRG